ncbi:c-type cytochrome [Ramlibacter tataouinensis]|nr:c-type cytochrome [Ramlibacter tataouinensis]WBY03945.1 c-type cytochrome [Ramlibacter tataouinensis]
MALLCGGASAATSDATALKHGEEVYGRCLACHAIEQNRTGPAHCGLFGRKAGTAPGYASYSAALKNSGITWNEATLSKFLADPMNTVPGTNMTYLGVTDAKERADLIAYLKQATQAGKACQLAK